MGRITNATINGEKADFENNQIEIDVTKYKSGVELDIGLHLDGNMKDKTVVISSSWSYAPETLLVYSSDDVEIPVSRLGGVFTIPSRVVGFDPRKLRILASWSMKQMKVFEGSMGFQLRFEYLEEASRTLLVNSGRGLVETPQASLACKIIRENNLDYVPIDSIRQLGRFRIRGFSDNSLHIDGDYNSGISYSKLTNYDYKSNFTLTQEDYVFANVKRDVAGLAIPTDKSNKSKISAILDDLMSISTIDYDSLTRDERSKIRDILSKISMWISTDMSLDDQKIASTHKLIGCIGLIRAGLLIGGRAGKKLMNQGVTLGDFLISKTTVLLDEIGGRLLVKNSVGSKKYMSSDQVFSIIALIYMKKAGLQIKAKDMNQIIGKLRAGLRLYKSESGYYKNLDHLFSDNNPERNDRRGDEILKTSLDWSLNVKL